MAQTMPPVSDTETQAHSTQVANLQHLLAEAIRGREWALNKLTTAEAAARHWFVPDGAGYCQACGLPEGNKLRHAPRPV